MNGAPVSLYYDAFSYGMVMYELFSHQLPFAEVSSPLVPNKILEGDRPDIPDTCEPYIDTLMRRCWNVDPKSRPNFREILSILKNKTLQTPTIRYLSELPVTKDWYALGLNLGISSQELDKFQHDYTQDQEMCKTKMFGAWLRTSSATFWNLINALLVIQRKDVAESISKKEGIKLPHYTEMDFEEDKRCFETAMKEGYIEASFMKTLFIGAGGAGKTHAVCLLRGVDPPMCRQSTEVARKAITLRVDVESHEKWEEIDTEARKRIIVDAMYDVAFYETTDAATLTKPVPLPDQSQEDKAPLPSSQPLETEKELIERIHEAIKSKVGGKILSIKWVYIVDTGGQPQFHELLSAFIKNAAVCAFVLKLSERLDHHPQVEYWLRGENIGKPFPHPLSNLGILELCVDTVQSLPREGNERPVLLVIGTHRDEQDQSTDETLADKNEMLQSILSKNCEFIKNRESLIFDVNAKTPQDYDQTLAKLLKAKIRELMPDPVQIPLRYYGLELELELLANTKVEGKGILSMEECRRIAGRLHFREKDLHVALNHLHKLNVVLYYPHILKEVLFCDPLVLLNIITKMVAYNYRLKHHSASSDEVLLASSLWQKSCDTGLIEVKQVESAGEIKSCFREKLFTPAHLFEVLEHLLIVALVNPISQQYFMPSLLDELETKEIIRPEVLPASLLFTFHVDGEDVYAPAGLFSALVAFLVSSENPDVMQSERVAWTFKDTDRGDKHYRNFVTLKSKLPPVDVTLINSHRMFEIFAKCSRKSLHVHLPEIKETIEDGLDKAKKARNFTHLTYNTTFVCKCSEAESEHLHPAIVQEKQWSCPHNLELAGSLHAKELVWFGEPLPAGPIIIEEPQSQLNVTPESSVSFCVEVEGTSPEYSWFYKCAESEDADFSRLDGKNKPVLQISNVQPSNEGYYVCKVSNSICECVETSPRQLTLLPQIIEHPKSVENIASGQPAVFSTKASGTDVKYSWHHQTSAGKTMLSENTSILRIENVQQSDEGDYICKITNPTHGFVETKPAQLTLAADKEVEEKRLLTAMKEIMKKKGELELTIVQGVFIGPGRNGKSSLMKRLLGKKLQHEDSQSKATAGKIAAQPREIIPTQAREETPRLPEGENNGNSIFSPSTSVAKKPLQVIIKRPTSVAAEIKPSNISVSSWSSLSFDEEVIKLLKTMAAAKLKTSQIPEAHHVPTKRHSGASLISQVHSNVAVTPPSIITKEKVTSPSERSTLENTATYLPTPSTATTVPKAPIIEFEFKTPQELFKDCLRDRNWFEAKKHLESTCIMYLTDTGGQIEFQELLPALVSGPSVFFIVFRLDWDLDEVFDVHYTDPEKGDSKPYKSSIKLKDALLQSLASIASMSTLVYKGEQMQSVPLQPVVFFVGTHRDVDKVTDDRIKEIDYKLKAEIP